MPGFATELPLPRSSFGQVTKLLRIFFPVALLYVHSKPMAAIDVSSPEWLTGVLGQPVASFAWAGGALDKINKNSSMRWGTVSFADSSTRTIVVKASDPGETGADPHGLAREGLFYSQWRSLCPPEVVGTLAAVLPDVYHSEGNMERGTKLILLEDLSDCVQCGYFFGPGNPNNWGKDLTAATKGVSLSVSAATALSFAAAARLHAPFWQSEALVKSPDLGWLRAGAWARGESRETWEASQTRVRTLWTAAKDKMGGGEVEWDPLLVACVDASVEKATWAAFQSELKTRPFTLVHGDFHPANIMVRSAGGVQSVALLDWEVVGVGSGPQDLGQFMLSHVDPATRKEIERGAVEAYHAELVKLNPAVAMTMEECWREYIDGGLGRWLWLLPLLVSMCPPPMVKFFVAQVHAFIVDHGVTPQSVPMPRA